MIAPRYLSDIGPGELSLIVSGQAECAKKRIDTTSLPWNSELSRTENIENPRTVQVAEACGSCAVSTECLALGIEASSAASGDVYGGMFFYPDGPAIDLQTGDSTSRRELRNQLGFKLTWL